MKIKNNLKGNKKMALLLALIILITVIMPLKQVRAGSMGELPYAISLGDGSFEQSTKLRRCKFRRNCYR